MGPLLDERFAVPYKVIAPRAFCRIRMAIHEREVHAGWFPSNELLLQCLLRSRILREHHETRRIPIDTMHDERPSALRPQIPFKLVVDGRFRAPVSEAAPTAVLPAC